MPNRVARRGEAGVGKGVAELAGGIELDFPRLEDGGEVRVDFSLSKARGASPGWRPGAPLRAAAVLQLRRCLFHGNGRRNMDRFHHQLIGKRNHQKDGLVVVGPVFGK